MATTPPATAHPFSFVPFESQAPPGAIACDGLVSGAELHASHWAGNRTPEHLKADTSVEIALRLAEEGVPRGYVVTNNHFDSDGILAVFALLSPDFALRHAGLITAAAEAGDFGEWPADERGLRLDMAILSLGARAGGDAAAYARVLPLLGELIEDIDAHKDLWESEWRALGSAEQRASEGALEVYQREGIAVFAHRPGVAELPGPILSRRAPPGSTRWLLAFEGEGGAFEYRYERPPWAWADTVRRPRVAPPSRNAIAEGLGDGWAIKGGMGMTGLLRTTRPIRSRPEEVLEKILERDPGARPSSAGSAPQDVLE